MRHVRDLAIGTVVLLPEELGRSTGYAEGGGSTSGLVPGHKNLAAVELAPLALVEVVAYPQELANAYLKGELARVDRRWRGARKARAGGDPGAPGAEDGGVTRKGDAA